MTGNALVAWVTTLTVTTAAEVPLIIAGFGEIEHVVFAGAPLQAKLTAPLNPFIPEIFNPYVAVCPAATVAVVEFEPPLEAIEKLAG